MRYTKSVWRRILHGLELSGCLSRGRIPTQAELTQQMIESSHEALRRSFFPKREEAEDDFSSVTAMVSVAHCRLRDSHEEGRATLDHLRKADDLLSMAVMIQERFDESIEPTFLAQCIALGGRLRKGLSPSGLESAENLAWIACDNHGLDDEYGQFLWTAFLQPDRTPELFEEIF